MHCCASPVNLVLDSLHCSEQIQTDTLIMTRQLDSRREESPSNMRMDSLDPLFTESMRMVIRDINRRICWMHLRTGLIS